MTSQQFFEKYGLGWLYRICLHVPILLATCCTMSPPIKLTIMITRSYILCNDSGIAQRSNGPLYWNMPLGIVSIRKHCTWNSDRRCIYLCFTYHLLGSSWRPALAQTILRFVDVVVMQPFVHCDVYIVLTSFKANTVCQTARFVDFFSKYSFGIVPLFVNIIKSYIFYNSSNKFAHACILISCINPFLNDVKNFCNEYFKKSIKIQMVINSAG
jgi:hypothetical protein